MVTPPPSTGSKRIEQVFRLIVLLAVVAAVLVMAARHPPRSPVVKVVDFDWHVSFPASPAGREMLAFRLTDPLGRSRLDASWSAPRQIDSEEMVVTARRRRSGIRFEWKEIVPRIVRLRCAAPWSLSGRPRVMLKLNGRRIGMLRATGALAEHSFSLPVQSQRTGENRLELVNPRLRTSRRAGAAVRPDEGIACSSIAIDEAENSARGTGAAARLTDDGIVLAPGRVLEAYARVGARDPQIEILATENGTLTITNEQGRSRSLRFPGDGERVFVPLDRFANEIVELKLANDGDRTLTLKTLRIISREDRGVSTERMDGRTGRAHFEQSPPLVLLVIVDTLRADHLGLYGYPRDTSPHLDRLAEHSLVFTNAVAQSSWTTPATGSILTGLTPRRHGAEHLSERMRADTPGLASALRAAGWRTGAFVTNTNARGELGFARGFDTHRLLAEEPMREGVSASADRLIDEALRWLDASDSRPTLLYLHPSDPHGPYAPPEDCRDRFAPENADVALRTSRDPARLLREDQALQTPTGRALLVARYDEEIVCLDRAFGRLRRELEARGIFDETLIVLTADHGEEFLDHGGFGHGRTLFGEQLHVPLVIRLPGGKGLRRADLARQIDIAPTILDVLGLGGAERMEGHSLMAGERERNAPARTFLAGSELRALTTPTHRYLRTRTPSGGFSYSAYDLGNDPGERMSLVPGNRVLLGWIRQHFAAEALSNGLVTGENRVLKFDSATRARLEALGYVDEGD